MPVLSMNEPAWEKSSVMMQNGPEMSGVRQHSSGIRSQDDATVGYFFQRPQTDVSQQYNSKRWAVGDDSVIEQARSVHELDRQFQQLGFEPREIAPNAKKIWEDDQKDAKAMFHGGPPNPWSAPREDAWGNNQGPGGDQQQRFQQGEHAMSHPISMMHRRSDPASVLSPRSSETGALGVNMAEYVLGGSPVGKEFDPRFRPKLFPRGPQMYQRPPMQEIPPGPGEDPNKVAMDKAGKAASPFEGEMKPEDVKDQIQSNGIMQNGLEEDGRLRHSRQNSPTEEEQRVPVGMVEVGRPMAMPGMMKQEDFMDPNQQMPQQQQQPTGLALDTGVPFEPMGIDPMSFDYSNQLMPSMDSPNFNLDYNQQQLLQRQQPIAVLTQQQYALAAQQQQLGVTPNNNTAFAPTPYIVNAQDPYALGIPIAGPAAVVPQYYQVQTPWGIYPAGLLQQQGAPQGSAGQQGAPQQQLLRQGGRPLTPSQQGNEPLGTPTGGLQQQQQPTLQAPGGAAGYQILAPAYYDQNGQLVMGNGRGIGTPVRLVPPGPILVNAAAAGQQGGAANGLGANTLRLLTTQQQQQQQQVQAPVVYTSSAGSTPQNQAMPEGYGQNNSLYTPASSSLFTPISSTLQPTYNNQGLGQLGTSATPGAIGSAEGLSAYSALRSGMPTCRRDSLEFKARTLQSMPAAFGPLAGSPAGQLGGPLTPPPNMLGSGPMTIGGLGSGNRLYSAAPGAENKYRSNGALSGSSGLFSSSLFPSRMLPKSASLSKEASGRSRLLEDFRNNRIPNLQLKDLVQHVVEFSQDQHGSRFIQQKLERATASEKAMVFSEILTAAYSLMTDVFGNYVIQKFFEFGSPEQKQTLAQRVRGHVLPLALQMYGCRVIQKALESIPQEMQVEIVKELDGHVLKCVKDQNGNHVVQKCIECVDPKQLQFIIDAFKGQVFALSTHPYGCRVIQRILEHCTPKQTAPILDELHCHTERLVQDQYGNYVIQHVLEHGHSEDKSKIVCELNGKVLALSQHKFASNVVEKCVSHSLPAERSMLIDEVCSINDGPHSALYSMMKDQFANYVVQKMIDVAEPAQRKLLMHKIRPHVPTLRKYTYGKHILAKLEKYYMKTAADLGPIGMPPNPNGALP